MNEQLEGGHRPRFQAAWLGPRYWPTWLGLGLFALLALAPKIVRRSLARWVGHFWYRRNQRRRAVVEANLRLCFPDWSEEQRAEVARDSFRVMAQASLDYALLWWAPARYLDRIIRVEGWEHVEAARREGRNVVMFTGHSAALDALGVAITRRMPTVGMMQRVKNPIIDWLIARGRTRFQGKVYLRDAGLRPILQDMRAGLAFYYQPDEDLAHVPGSEWVFAPFFGEPKATLTSLGRLTKIARADAIPCMGYSERDGSGWRVRFDPPLEGFPGGEAEADATAMNRALERLVAADPAQYMWTLRWFKTRPEGVPSPYPGRRGPKGEGEA